MSKKGINIHKRKDGRWEGRYKVGVLPSGYARYASVYGKSYTDAKEKLYAAIALKSTARAKTAERTFSEVMHMWLENNRLRQKGATEHKYRSLIESHIEPALGAFSISDVTSLTINDFLAEELNGGGIAKKGGLSPSYVRTMAQIIQSVMHFAVREEYCLPLKTDILKPIQEKKELQILTHEEERILEKYCLAHLEPTALGILVTLYAGLRIGEVCALSWEDIDLDCCVMSCLWIERKNPLLAPPSIAPFIGQLRIRRS